MIPARRCRPARSGRRTGLSPAARLRCPPVAAPRRSAAGAFFGVVLRPRSWLNLLYLALSFPLGLFYFVVLVTLLAVGIGLVIIWVGIFILALTAAAWWAFASFERSLADGLLGTHLQPAPRPWQTANGTWPRIKAHFASLATWKDLAFLFLKFPLGLASFCIVVVLGALSLASIAAPFYYGHVRSTGAGGVVTRGIDFGAWTVDRLWQALLLVPLGVLLLIVSMHVFNGLAAVWRAIARGLLETAGEPRPQATAAGEAGRPSLAETQAPSWNPYSYPPPPAAQPQPPSQGWPSQPPAAGRTAVGSEQPSALRQPPYPGQAPYRAAPIRARPIVSSQPPYPSPPPYPGWPYAAPPAYPAQPAYPPPAYPSQPDYPPQPPQPEQPAYPAQAPTAQPTAPAGPPSDRPRPAPPAPSGFPAPPWGEWPSLYGPPAGPEAAASESPPAEPASHDNPPAEEERP